MKIKENAVEFKIDYLTLEVYPCDSKYNSMKFGVFQNDTEDITRLFCNNNIDGNIITDWELDDIIHKCKEFSIIFMNNCRIGDGVSKQNIDNIIYKELGTNHKISYVNTSADGYIKYGYIECVLHEGEVKDESFEPMLMPEMSKFNLGEMDPKNFKINHGFNMPLAPMPSVSPEEFFQSSFEPMPDMPKCNFEKMGLKNFKINPGFNIPVTSISSESPEYSQSSFDSVKNDSENSKNSDEI